MLITRKLLTDLDACSEGKEWFLEQNVLKHEPGILNLLEKGHPEWANWLMVRLLSHRQQVLYACFAAKQVLSIFEKAFPKDKRPRQAINAALKWAKYPTEVNRSAARSACSAARSAWSAARSAAMSAESAAMSAESAAQSAESAAMSAMSAEFAARKQLQLKILKYGFKLMREGKYK